MMAAAINIAFSLTSISRGNLRKKLSASVTLSLISPVFSFEMFPTSTPSLLNIWYSNFLPQFQWQQLPDMEYNLFPLPSSTRIVGTQQVLSRLSFPSSTSKLLMVMNCLELQKQQRKQKQHGQPHGAQAQSL